MTFLASFFFLFPIIKRLTWIDAIKNCFLIWLIRSIRKKTFEAGRDSIIDEICQAIKGNRSKFSMMPNLGTVFLRHHNSFSLMAQGNTKQIINDIPNWRQKQTDQIDFKPTPTQDCLKKKKIKSIKLWVWALLPKNEWRYTIMWIMTNKIKQLNNMTNSYLRHSLGHGWSSFELSKSMLNI